MFTGEKVRNVKQIYEDEEQEKTRKSDDKRTNWKLIFYELGTQGKKLKAKEKLNVIDENFSSFISFAPSDTPKNDFVI